MLPLGARCADCVTLDLTVLPGILHMHRLFFNEAHQIVPSRIKLLFAARSEASLLF